MKKTLFSRVMRVVPGLVCALCAWQVVVVAAELTTPIDRQALVARHRISSDNLESTLGIGNGNFCFNVDGTGLQTFGGDTLSHWGWYSEPLPEGFTWDDVAETGTYWQGRLNGADPWPADKGPLYGWTREAPHQMNLARIRFTRSSGAELKREEISNVKRDLDLWTGVHTTTFTLDGEQVEVVTCVTDDVKLDSSVAIRVRSELLKKGALAVQVDFPYPSLRHGAWDGDFSASAPETPFTIVKPNIVNNALIVKRELKNEYARGKIGNYSYATRLDVVGGFLAQVATTSSLFAIPTDAELYLLATFDGGDYCGQECDDSVLKAAPIKFEEALAISAKRWENFWLSGAAVDLSESSDPRWRELERRIVLSQFHLRSNAAGNWPCSEMGLLSICNWSGRFHMEMVWWHLIHWWAWDRAELADDAIKIYPAIQDGAKQLAEQLGYKGLKWQKEVAPDGRTAPWQGNLALLWKQPHAIYFAEMDYRRAPTQETLAKWSEIVEQTAVHMADYATKDANGVYHLTPSMPPSEQGITSDDIFDLAYWRWGLDVANTWRERQGKERDAFWDEVRLNMEPLPIEDGVYVHSPEWRTSFTERNWEHPDLIGVYGMVPPTGVVDLDVARHTLERVIPEWNWSRCWGWDFPWTCMAATRLGRPDLAIEAILLEQECNIYNEAGVNLGGPSPLGGKGYYLPGNGGLLMAVAGMCAGFDENASDDNTNANMPKSGDSGPGFPEGWKVKWENIKRPL